MFRPSDLYANLLKKEMSSDCGITIEPLNSEVALLNRQLLADRVSFFSINLISSGHVSLLYDGKRVSLKQNDLFISAPGIRIYTEEVSDDYSGVCLIVEEDVIFNMPYARKLINGSYSLAKSGSEYKICLSDSDFNRLTARIEEIQTYIAGTNHYKAECIYSLFTVLSLDIINIEDQLISANRMTSVTAELFIRFLRLMRENFTEHHEIEFYSDSLSVTSIYLSRIVKRISGQTVKNHIDRHLMMEAKFLLVRSSLPIARIGEKLNFANPASFCKFFLRHQGITPKQYRLKECNETTA